MNIKQALVEFVTGQAAIAALIGTRFYPLTVPQDASLPAVAYQKISDPRDYTHSGASGLSQARMQLTFLGSTVAETNSVAAAFEAAMSGFKGWWGTVRIDSCYLENDYDTYAEQHQQGVIRHDYRIWYHT